MTQAQLKMQIKSLRVERVRILDQLEYDKEHHSDALVQEDRWYLIDINREIAKLMAIAFA